MLLGFKERFRAPILSGSKIFTLRDKRKHDPKIGETLYMYTGLRTTNCHRITDKFKLKGIQHVVIEIETRSGPRHWGMSIVVDGKELTKEQHYRFVEKDGFIDIPDFCNYWLTAPGKKQLLSSIKVSKTMYHWTDFKY